MNRVVEMVLHYVMHAGRDNSQWETLLPTVEFVINNSPMQATGYTPFYLNYGFQSCTLADLIWDYDTTLVESVNSFVYQIKANFSLSVQYLHKVNERMKVQSDKKRWEIVFCMGEQVLLSTEHLNIKNAPIHKLKRRFVGPFFVVCQVGPICLWIGPSSNMENPQYIPH